jgi:hypothetical protein
VGKNPEPESVDGYPNFFHFTRSPGNKRVTLERGINAIASVKGPDGNRTPAILLSSSPHKIGSLETPWQDFFNPDEGHVRYFGDTKSPGVDPTTSPGNSRLLSAKRLQDSMEIDDRRFAPPILLFRRMKVGSAVKGYPSFQGFGVIERAQLISQYDGKNERSFPNYAFDIAVLNMSHEKEEFDWRWITDRRNGSMAIEETERFAPSAWKEWVKSGQQSLPNLKRRVTKLLTTPTSDQRPPAGSPIERALDQVYNYYEGRKHRFEILAARIAGRILESQGGNFRFGWITPPSSDGGADFVGRLDVGSGFSTVKQVVFGQAKCENPASTTSGRDIARTAARLRRGWIGAYVTLGAFSEAVQREVIDDEYPIILIPGYRVAEELITLTAEAGLTQLIDFVKSVDDTYDSMVIDRRPEEILRE